MSEEDDSEGDEDVQPPEQGNSEPAEKKKSGMTWIGRLPKDHVHYKTHNVYVGINPPDRPLAKRPNVDDTDEPKENEIDK